MVGYRQSVVTWVSGSGKRREVLPGWMGEDGGKDGREREILARHLFLDYHIWATAFAVPSCVCAPLFGSVFFSFLSRTTTVDELTASR